MKKRLGCLLLVIIMIISAFAGCGKKNPGSKGNAKGDGKLSVGILQNIKITEYKENAFTKYLEEACDVELEFVFFSSSTSEFSQQLSLMVSANEELPDVLLGFNGMNRHTIYDYGEDGYFLDLTELLTEEGTYYQEAKRKVSKELQKLIDESITNPADNKIYGAPSTGTIVALDHLQSPIFINQTWLNTLGLQTPKTVEELYNVLVAFRDQDPNGNGKEDEIPLLAPSGGQYDVTSYLINAFVYYDNLNPVNITNGKVWEPAETDEYRQALIYANKLCSEGLLSDMSYTIKSKTEFQTLYTPNDNVAKVGMWIGHPSLYTATSSTILDQYTAIGALADATGKGGYDVLREQEVEMTSFITSSCKDIEAAKRLIDIFYKDETVTRMRNGEKGVDWDDTGKGEDICGIPNTNCVLNAEAYFSGSQTWGMCLHSISTNENFLTVCDVTGNDRQAHVNRLCRESTAIAMSAKQPEEVSQQLIYTSEENEVREQYNSIYREYVEKQRVLFVTGKDNPSDDTAWKTYLDKLNLLGKDKILETVQSAYNRKMSK